MNPGRGASGRRFSVVTLLLIFLIGAAGASAAHPRTPSRSARKHSPWILPAERPIQHERSFEPGLIQSGSLIRAAEARSTYAVNGNGLTVAVLDTGLRTTHVDFSGRVVAQRNFTADNGGDVNNAADGNGHGTNVSGIIAANSIHVGIAPGANVIALKVLPNVGGGSFAAIDQALQWVIDNRVAHAITAVNMSIQDGGNYPTAGAGTIRTKTETLRAAGVAVVCCAGNNFFAHSSAQGQTFPAIIPASVSVGAVYDANVGGFNYASGAQAITTAADRITPFTQRLHPTAEATHYTDIFAPGAPVTSSGISSDTGASTQHGTSQATPATAGVILLMQEYHLRVVGTLPTIDRLETWLRAGAVSVFDGDNEGDGVIDADDEDDNVTNTNLTYLRVDAVGAMQAMIAEISGASVTVTSPNGGETLTAGAQQSLTWTSSGISGSVKLEYSTNGGSGWTTIAASTPNDGNEIWTVPSTGTSQGRVRVTSLSSPGISDISNAHFTIVLPVITVTSPNGGEAQVVNTNEPITWTSSNVTGPVKIEYSVMGGAPDTWMPIQLSTENDGFALWTVQGPDSGQARIRVSAVGTDVGADISDSDFTIITPTVYVLSPNGGETLLAGTTRNITWATAYVADYVKIEYSINGGSSWIPIYNATENDGVAAWSVQPPATTQARIRISQASNPARCDISDGNFTIQANPLTLTSPNGGEVQEVGSTQAITWISNGVSGSVKIDYSTDGGSMWMPIYTSTENDGFALWTVQGPPTTQARIRISSVGTGSPADTSDANFTITAVQRITVTSPNGDESQVVGTTEPITWTSTGVAGSVKIDYSTDGGLSWLPIYPSTENDGVASWTVQAPVTAQARIRVSSVLDPTVADISDLNFTIRPDLTLTYVSTPNLAIPDSNSTGIEVPLLVSSIRVAHAVHVGVNITHTWIGDLEVSLIHPDGTTVRLHNRTGGSADNLVTKYPIFTLPAEDLAVLNHKPFGGTWKLKVRDLEAPDTGTLNCWTLTLVY
jgi:subtilisin-like proprotein convertase family protein